MSTKKALTNCEQDSFCQKTELLKRLEDHKKDYNREDWQISENISMLIIATSKWFTNDREIMEENKDLYEAYVILASPPLGLKILIQLHPITDQ